MSSSQSVKLHATDLLVTGTICRTFNPLRSKTKRISANRDKHLFYIKSNNEVVNHQTNVSLKLNRIRLARANLSFENPYCGGADTGFTIQEIAKTLILYCDKILPVNILTNSKEMAAILNYVIKTNLPCSEFRVIPPEAKINKKYKPKIKVWCLKSKKMAVISLQDMITFYEKFSNRRNEPFHTFISVSKQHPYLMCSPKYYEEKKEKEGKEEEEEEFEEEEFEEEKEEEEEFEEEEEKEEEDFEEGEETCVTVFSFIDDNVSEIYKGLGILPLEYRNNTSKFSGCPVIHIDMNAKKFDIFSLEYSLTKAYKSGFP